MSDERTIKPNAPADFTPQLGDYKTLQPFRYWCQKVLPLVYDDSLSYYELLCKTIDYLNKTMEDVEILNGDINSLHTAYTELQSYVNNYFSTLDVQEEINNKLDELVTSGRLDVLFNNYVPYVTPEMYGAKGDGTTNDYNAFVTAFSKNSCVILTKNKTYLINGENPIDVTNALLNGNNATIKTTMPILFTATDYRGTTIKGCNFYYIDNFKNANECLLKYNYRSIILENCYINNFNKVIEDDNSHIFNGYITFNRVTISKCKYAIYCGNKRLTFTSFNDCVISPCDVIINASTIEAVSFNNCDIEGDTIFCDIRSVYRPVEFNSCYFEGGIIFNGDLQQTIAFNGCWFYLKKNTFNITSDIITYTFNNCIFGRKEVNDSLFNLIKEGRICIRDSYFNNEEGNLTGIPSTLFSGNTNNVFINVGYGTFSKVICSSLNFKDGFIKDSDNPGYLLMTPNNHDVLPTITPTIIANTITDLKAVNMKGFLGLSLGFVKDTKHMYVFNGSNWYEIADYNNPA